MNTGSVSKRLGKFVTLGATSVVVASFMASPVPAVAANQAPMSHLSTNYAHVSRAPELPSGARQLAAAAASKTISGAVALAPRDPAALQAAAAAVSNPRSKTFRHYIAKGTFAQNYGPTTATINAVKATLQASHLSVSSVSSNGLLVHFRGTIGQAESAFRTNIANFRLPSGRTGIQTTKPLSFPASIAHQVVSVLGLDTLAAPATSLEHATHPAATKPVTHHFHHAAGSATPCAAATDIANEFGGLTDDQIAHSYGVDGLYNAGDLGGGQTVAIYELEPFSTSDVSTFDTCYFGATKAAQMASRLNTIKVDGGAGTGTGSGESILDVDDVSGLAPDANINVYEAPNTNAGGMDEYNKIVTDDTAQVISTSWGLCELDAANLEPGYINVENDIFEQAALQGQSVFADSGDAGSDGCAYHNSVPAAPTLSTSDPGTQPFVTSVGGTTITNAQNPPTEQVWNDGSIGGGAGGGVSSVWGAPAWQQPFLDTAAAAHAVTAGGLTPCAQSSNASLCREVPDISAQADEYTGAITIYTTAFGGWTTEGGTSSSAPLWAAMLSDIDASTTCTTSGHPVGFVSPALYAVAANVADDAASFNDVTAGNNDLYDISNGVSYAAHAGYDMASGLGTPKVTGPGGTAGLAEFLCQMGQPAAPRPAITSLSSPTEKSSPTGSLTITGTGFTGATGLSFGGFDVPAGDWVIGGGGTTITVNPVPTASQAGTGGAGPQDGNGRAIISVTDVNGVTSLPSAAGTLLYVAGTVAAPIPSVDGVLAYGGDQTGGNTVSVYGSDFTTTGPDAITHVTIGGVDAASFAVVAGTNGSKLSVVIPAYNSGTTVCKGGDDPVNDVCQAQVVVTNANGSSATATIHAPYTGAPFLGVSGGAPLPACVTGHTCEIVSATSEYDYFATPTITSITTTSPGDATTWASEQGTTIATIDGKGFDSLGFDWVNIGNPTVSDNADLSTINLTPTELQVVINPHEPTTEPAVRGVTVQTLGGLSNSSPISYAGIPTVKTVTPSSGPDTGGTAIAVTGKGFEGLNVADGGMLAYQYIDYGVATNQLSGYSTSSDTALTATTPANNPGSFTVQACTITFCSEPSTFGQFLHSLYDFYQPGAPKVTSMSVHSGPASGGTLVLIHGQNLSDAVQVFFGKKLVESANAPEILTNGSSTEIAALSPPAKPGAVVNVRVVTAESLDTGGSGSAASAASTFTFKSSVASAPQDVRAAKHGTAVSVTWKAPASNGGHAITKYRVRAVALPNSDKKGAKKPPTVVVVTKHASARSATLTGLRGGWVYRIKVQAVNSKGRGLPGEPRRFFFISDPA